MPAYQAHGRWYQVTLLPIETTDRPDAAIPLQGMYSASKHAVKGFTDSLRMELEAEGAPISVVYPSRRLLSPSVRAFVDFLVGQFATPPWEPEAG